MSSGKITDIIIVDDDTVSTYLTEEILRENHVCENIQSYSSGIECLKNLENDTDAHTILLDLNMPEINGWDFLKKCRAMNRTDLIILLTSSINEDDRERAQYENVHFLNKPLDTDDLLKIITGPPDESLQH